MLLLFLLLIITTNLRVPRWTYPDFFNRYRVLMKRSDMTNSDKKLVCRNLLATVIKVQYYTEYNRVLQGVLQSTRRSTTAMV